MTKLGDTKTTNYLGWMALITVAVILFTHDFIMTAINIAVIPIAASYDVSLGSVSKVVSTYVLSVAAIMLTSGILGEKFGNSRIFIIGILSFLLGSILAPIAPNFLILVVSRALQGIGTGLVLPNSIVIIFQSFPYDKQGLAIGIVVAISGIAMALGPSLGSVVVHYLGWRWLFYVCIASSATAFLMSCGLYTKLNHVAANANRKLGVLDNLIFIIGLYILLFMISTSEGVAWSAPMFYIPSVFSILVLSIFFIRQFNIKKPLINIDIFKNTRYLAAVLADGLLMFTYIAILFLVSLYLHSAMKLPTEKVGSIFLIMAATYIIFSPYVGFLYARVGARWLNLIACIGAIIGICGMIVFHLSLIPIFIGLALMGFAIAVSFSCLTTMSLDVVDKQFASMAAAIFFTIQYVGASLGITVSSLILSGFSYYKITGLLVKHHLHLSDYNSIELHDLVTGLEGHLSGLSEPVVKMVLKLSSYAFIYAYRWSLAVCVLMMLISLIITYFMMKQPPKIKHESSL